MKSFLEVDDLNLGGHRRIAVHIYGETNQYSSTARCVAELDCGNLCRISPTEAPSHGDDKTSKIPLRLVGEKCA